MTMTLPNDLEGRARAAVLGGRFATIDDATAEAARLLLKELDGRPAVNAPATANDSGTGLIGALREDADLLDQAVEHAMRVREERPWRSMPVE